jgi:hypothetical protein
MAAKVWIDNPQPLSALPVIEGVIAALIREFSVERQAGVSLVIFCISGRGTVESLIHYCFNMEDCHADLTYLLNRAKRLLNLG